MMPADLKRYLWTMAAALLLLLAMARTARAEALEVTVVTLEGDERADKLLGISEGAFKFESGSVAMKDLSEVRFGARNKTAGATPTLYLRNGDELKAAILSGDDSKLKLKTAAAGEFELENKFLNAIAFPLKDGPTAEAIEAFVKAPSAKEDLLLLAKGDTVAGVLEKFSDKDLSFNSGNQSRVYLFSAIAAFRLAPLDDFKDSAEFRATVMLKDGSRLTGKLAGMEEKSVTLQTVTGKAWNLDSAALHGFMFKGGKLVYLSDLKPATVEEKPYVGGMPIVFAWRRDQSVNGDKLSIAGKSFPRGIGVHSFARLVYGLEGQYARFLCEAGIDAGAASNGDCAWRVLVDGKEVKTGRAKSGAPAEKIKLDIAGAKQLELICDYGADDDDAGDHLDWANARLIKP